MDNVKKVKYLLICLLLLSACSTKSYDEKIIAPFTYTNQDGQQFGSENLDGKLWIANFIFTNCETVCPPMTTEMAALQQQFKNEGIQVEFISFTVDPLFDSPKILKSYAENFTNDLSNWNLLTGYSQDEIEIFARNQFQTIVQKPTSSTQVIHSTNFYLINQEGVLVNEYSYIDAAYIEELLTDIQNTKLS